MSASAHTAQSRESSSQWTFLTNHAHVIILLGMDGEMTIRDLSLRIGITERAVQRILADLLRDGYIAVTKSGRRNSYTIRDDKNFRHPIEANCEVRSLITLVKKSLRNPTRTNNKTQ